MSRYYPRRRYGGNARYSGAIRHMQERRELSADVFGLDNDIIERVFRLNSSELAKFFNFYYTKFGKKDGDYAISAFPLWKSKQRGISGMNAKRFIELAPKIFSFDDRYDIVSKLYDKTRREESHYLTVVIGIHEGAFQEVEKLYVRLCQKPLEHEWPDKVKRFVSWICDEDTSAAKTLITAIETQLSILTVKAARVEIDRLTAAVQNIETAHSGNHTIKLPYGTISICIRKPTIFEKIKKLFT